jgi:DHA1 family bicyclomycin/chloramphenicol resistance-like MFS transporter
MLAYVTMAMVVAPMMAPALGGVLTDHAGWRSVFVFGGALGLLVLLVVSLELPETAAARSVSARRMGLAFLGLLRSRAFLGYAFQGGFSMAVFFCFLGAAPYLMVKVLGRPASEYGFLFIMISAAFMLGNFGAARLSQRLGADRMIVLGSVGNLAGSLALLGLVAAGSWSALGLFVPAAFGAFAQGLSMPNAQAAVVSVNPAAAGSASGLAGFLQMGMAGAAAQAVGSIQNGTPYPMAVGMTLASAAALAAALVAARSRRHA